MKTTKIEMLYLRTEEAGGKINKGEYYQWTNSIGRSSYHYNNRSDIFNIHSQATIYKEIRIETEWKPVLGERCQFIDGANGEFEIKTQEYVSSYWDDARIAQGNCFPVSPEGDEAIKEKLNQILQILKK